MALRKRPRPLKEETDITVENLEHNLRHIDDMLIDQDSRRISQQTVLATSASLDDVIASLNAFYLTMNQSELTEES